MVRTASHWRQGHSGASRSLLATPAQLGFLTTVCIEALLVIGLVAAVFGLVELNANEQTALLKTIPTYLAIFVFGALFSVVITLDALRLRNIIQIFGILVFNLGLAVYAALQVVQTREALYGSRPAYALDEPENCAGFLYLSCRGPDSLYRVVRILLVVVPVVIGVAEVVLIGLSWPLWQEFGWEVFKTLGGDQKQRRRYRSLQVLIALLKFSWFFLVGFTMQFLILVPTSFLDRKGGGGTAEFALTVAAVPLSLIVVATCILAVKREIRWLLALCLAVLLAGIAYFAYKLASLWLPRTRHYFDSTRNTLAVFSCMSIVLLSATVGVGVRVWLSFGKGLLNALEPKRPVLPAALGGGSSSPSRADKGPAERFVIE